MSVFNGQDVSAEVTNPAFLKPDVDDKTLNKLGCESPAGADGKFVKSIQRYLNNLGLTLGLDTSANYSAEADATGNTYSSTSTIVSNGDRVKAAITKLANAFAVAGHAHTGSGADGAPIASLSIAGTPLRGYFELAPGVTGVTGSSVDVSSSFVTKTASSGSTVAGVVVDPSYNKTIILATSGAFQNEPFTDNEGNIVYGRITKSGSVWTLSFYTLIGTTETAYSFASSTDFTYFYQELFNPLNSASPPPVYDVLATMLTDKLRPATRGGRVALNNGDQSVSITFSKPMPDTNYTPDALTFINTVDVQPQFLQAVVTARSASGMTVTFNAQTDSANYVLAYRVTADE